MKLRILLRATRANVRVCTDTTGRLKRILKAELKKILDEFDHRFLNELETFAQDNPTAENIARKIYQRLASAEIFSGSTKLYAVKVHESPNSCVTYYE